MFLPNKQLRYDLIKMFFYKLVRFTSISKTLFRFEAKLSILAAVQGAEE